MLLHYITPSRSPHNALHSPSYWGERSEPHTCCVNGKLSIYLFLYIYIYIYMVRAYSVYTSCPICARCNISTLHVGSCNHCCSRDETNMTERLNSGNQRNRSLKTVRNGRHYYQNGGWLLTCCVTLPPTGSASSVY